MDISKEAGNFVAYINKDIARGFRASRLADNSVRAEFSDSEHNFDIVLVADSAYNVFVLDFCQAGMNEVPKMFLSRAQLGYFMLKMSEYNVKMNRRLSK
jgi:hypothetical protein